MTGVGDELEAALASLKPGKIVGVGAITGRDDAMTAAEAGVDYLMFGDADGTQSFAEILEQVNWWAEIFNVPCVAYARKHEEIAEFVRAGADFVALCDAVWSDPRGIDSALREAAEVLASIREVHRMLTKSIGARLSVLAVLSLAQGAAAFAVQPTASPPNLATSPEAKDTVPTLAKTRDSDTPDLAYGAFQRGYYGTALHEAMKRLEVNPNDAAAMTLIGQLYAQGLGVGLNDVEAAHWYKLAADLGDREALFALGLAALKGAGVPKDRSAAAELFKKAAARNQPAALYNLGLMALENDGVASDFGKASDYFKASAELGLFRGGLRARPSLSKRQRRPQGRQTRCGLHRPRRSRQ